MKLELERVGKQRVNHLLTALALDGFEYTSSLVNSKALLTKDVTWFKPGTIKEYKRAVLRVASVEEFLLRPEFCNVTSCHGVFNCGHTKSRGAQFAHLHLGHGVLGSIELSSTVKQASSTSTSLTDGYSNKIFSINFAYSEEDKLMLLPYGKYGGLEGQELNSHGTPLVRVLLEELENVDVVSTSMYDGPVVIIKRPNKPKFHGKPYQDGIAYAENGDMVINTERFYFMGSKLEELLASGFIMSRSAVLHHYDDLYYVYHADTKFRDTKKVPVAYDTATDYNNVNVYSHVWECLNDYAKQYPIITHYDKLKMQLTLPSSSDNYTVAQIISQWPKWNVNLHRVEERLTEMANAGYDLSAPNLRRMELHYKDGALVVGVRDGKMICMLRGKTIVRKLDVNKMIFYGKSILSTRELIQPIQPKLPIAEVALELEEYAEEIKI